jgi:4-hydroxy-2-oxoheptanedioate aldolase
VRAARYSSLSRNDYFRMANEETLTMAMIEGAVAVANLESILDVPGVDLVFVGPYDLSQALGVPGQVGHPLVMEAMNEIVKQAQARKVALGTFSDDAKTALRWAEAGVQFNAIANDVGLLYKTAGQLVKDLKGAV